MTDRNAPDLVTCQKCGKSARYGMGTHFKFCGWELNAEFLWPRVDVRGPDECWPWKKALGTYGYGKILFKRKNIDAHRVAWMVANGPIPAGMHVLHRCDYRACCNPAHLFLGTNNDNMADCLAKGRKARGEKTLRNKLTEKDVLAIRAKYRKEPWGAWGRTNAAELSAEYGVTPGTIINAAERRTWEYLK